LWLRWPNTIITSIRSSNCWIKYITRHACKLNESYNISDNEIQNCELNMITSSSSVRCISECWTGIVSIGNIKSCRWIYHTWWTITCEYGGIRHRTIGSVQNTIWKLCPWIISRTGYIQIATIIYVTISAREYNVRASHD
jgi:hypothetical protein